VAGMVGTIRSWPRRVRDSANQEGAAPATVRQADEKDTNAIVGLRGWYTPEQLRARWRAEEKCYLVLLGDELVGLRWASTGQGRLWDLGLVLPLRTDEVWSSEAYTHPAHRHAGVYVASRVAFDRLCVQSGICLKLGSATIGRRPFGTSGTPSTWQPSAPCASALSASSG
jgi:hypothetical protein